MDNIEVGRFELIVNALNEISTSIGSSLVEPKSVSLLLYNLGLNIDDEINLMVIFRKISSEFNFQNMTNKQIYDFFRNEISKTISEAKEYDDKVIFSLIRAYSKTLVEDLYPLSCQLQMDFL